ncbi:MAG: electron transport complex subunit RsxC [Clostridia bacterium]|nr:electron transport complex subunit RsxC [Clostridia bacterium]
MFGFKFLGNTPVPHRKNTAAMPAVRLPVHKEVLLHVAQHIGAPAKVVVKVGDEVKVGTLIAEAGGAVSAPVHSSVSGKVTKIEKLMCYNGQQVDAVRIESDGLMTADESITPPDIHDLDSLIEAVRASGAVGLGGAGFPTAVKLAAAKNGNIKTVVINGAECEPYITSDTRTMLDDTDSVVYGVKLLLDNMPTVEQIIFGIESNKRECINKLSEAFKDNAKVKVKALPALYPQGSEKVIVHNTTGIAVPTGKLPAECGVIVLNVSTLAFIARYAKTGMPLVERTLTVDGSAIAEPKNVTVPVGTPISYVIEAAGGIKDGKSLGKVLYGGPMMGVCVCTVDDPVLKTTNAITALDVKDSNPPAETACIHCGRCVAACPHSLNPTEFARALNVEIKEDRMAKLQATQVLSCMECGCCSFVCPAHRPLIQNNRIAKAELKDYLAHQATLKN